jgi:hypothetical protein
MPDDGTLGRYGVPIALCRLYFQGGNWLALGFRAQLSVRYEVAVGHGVLIGEVAAAAKEGRVVAWGHAYFRRLPIPTEGSLRAASEISGRFSHGNEAQRLRYGGLWIPDPGQEHLFFQRASTMILGRWRHGRAMGVIMTRD